MILHIEPEGMNYTHKFIHYSIDLGRGVWGAAAKLHLAARAEHRDERAVPARARAMLPDRFVLALRAGGPDDLVPVALAHGLGGAAGRARHPGD